MIEPHQATTEQDPHELEAPQELYNPLKLEADQYLSHAPRNQALLEVVEPEL